jgi:hypothetical protein
VAARKKKQDTVSRFTIEGKPYEIDMDSLTWGEIEEVELYFDRPYDAIDFESARGAMMLAYLARKRKEPGYTLDKMRELPVDSVEATKPERPTKPPAVAGSPS